MSVKLTWHGEKIKRSMRAAFFNGMEAAGKSFVYHIRSSINKPFPPASAPGEPPHKRSGNLQAAVDYWVKKGKLELDIGVNIDAPYWSDLEFGTKKMEARPFIGVAVKRWLKNANRLIARAIKRNAGFLK